LIIAAIALVLDQVTKWIILEHVMTPPRVIDVTGFFNLVLVYNRGVSFGLFGDGAVSALVLKAVAMVVVAGLIWWMRQAYDLLVRVALGLVVGGAIGNIIDRAVHGAVVDFLDFHVAGYHWPAFNVADSAIVIGVGLLLWDAFRMRKQTDA